MFTEHSPCQALCRAIYVIVSSELTQATCFFFIHPPPFPVRKPRIKVKCTRSPSMRLEEPTSRTPVDGSVPVHREEVQRNCCSFDPPASCDYSSIWIQGWWPPTYMFLPLSPRTALSHPLCYVAIIRSILRIPAWNV